MKLPDYARTFSPSMIIGLGLQWVWMYAVLYAAFPAYFLNISVVRTVYYPMGNIALLFFAATTIVMGMLIGKITFHIRRRTVQITVAAVMALGTLCLLLSEMFFSVPLVAFADVINGVSSAFLLLIWSEAYRRRTTPSIVMNTILSLVFAFVLFGLTASFLSPLISGLLYCVMPLFEVIILLATLHGIKALLVPQPFVENTDTGKRVPKLGLLEIPTFRRLRVRKGMFIVRFGVPSLLFGLAFGPLCAQAFSGISQLRAAGDIPLVPMAIASLIALALIILLYTMNRSEEYDTFYRFVLPVLALMIFFTSFLADGFTYNLFVFASYICFEFMMWVEFCELSHRYRISPILVTGFGRAAVTIGMIVSNLIVEQMRLSSTMAFDGNVVNMFLIVTLLLGYFLLPRESDIREMAVIDPQQADGVIGSTGYEGELASIATRRGRFVERCELIANTYLLSNRETDVFYLLAKGRNAAYIATNLYISEGTVHTHTWRIYKKLNIHTQQELINLVDNVVVEVPGAAASEVLPNHRPV
jgi:DNA-binding CsgD family transcriptional regulator/MFS family permease